MEPAGVAKRKKERSSRTQAKLLREAGLVRFRHVVVEGERPVSADKETLSPDFRVDHPRPVPTVDGLRIAPLRITLIFVAVGLTWIWGTDFPLFHAGNDTESRYWISAIKGSAFIGFCALLIYWLARREFWLAARANALLRAVAEGTTDAVFIKDSSGKYILCNESAARFIGHPVHEILGKDDTAWFDPRGAEHVKERDRRVLATGRPETEEEELTSAGVTRTYLAMKAPFRDEQGRVVGVIGISRDITERKRAQNALREQEAFARGVLDAISAHVAVLDATGLITAANESWRQFSAANGGTENATGVGVNYLDVCERSAKDGDPTAATVAKGLRQVLAGEAPRFRFEYPCDSPNEKRWFQMSVTRLDHHSRGIVVVHTNISERKVAEDALRASESQLRLFAEHVPAPIAMLDRDLRYLQVSRRWLTDYRLGDRDLTGLHHYEVFPEIPESWREIHRQCLGGATKSNDEEAFVRADGTTQWIRWEIRPWSAPKGEIGGIIIFSEEITERKRAEQTLREREARFQKIFENAGTGIAIADSHGRLLECNPAFCSLLGYSMEELRQTSFASHIHPDDRETNLAQIERLRTGQIQAFEIENRYRHKDGRSVWVHKFTSLLPGESPEPKSMMALITDVTARRAAEQALRESEQRHREIMDVLPGAVFVHADNKIVFCNPAFVRLVGAANADDLLGKSPFDIVHPDHHQFVRARIEARRQSNTLTPGMEMAIVRLDGRAVPVYSVAAAFSGYAQRAILVALSDLTERERSMELLRSVLKSVQDAILTIDENGVIQSANPGAERAFGYSEAELVGQKIGVLMPPPYREEHDGYVANYLRTGVARVIGTGREAEALHRDGTRFPVEITVTEFRLEGERRFTGVVRDITARQRLEAELQQAQKMEAVGRLAGGVAHDFNNLLTVINGYSDMLLSKMPEPPLTREFLVAIRDAGDRAARLTQQLLAFSRKAVVEPRVIDLNELVKQSAKLLRRLIGEDILLEVVQDPDLPPIKADYGQIEQLVMNLVVNARDAMPTGGRLTILTKKVVPTPEQARNHVDFKPGIHAQIAVVDTGHGMTDEVKNRIFEPFFTTKGIGKGTGLGLAVVHGVVTQCGGHVDVQSTVGEGTTFQLRFPAFEGESPRAELAEKRIAASGRETILLVEDEESVRAIARRALEEQGYKVLETGRGVDAIRLATEHDEPIDLLVTDVVMPEVGGRQLADAVRAHRPGVRVLYISGYTDDSVVHHGVLDASDAFLQKPFTPTALARKVRAVLDGD